MKPLFDVEKFADVIAQAIEMATAPLHARINVLEARPVKGVSWAGVFTPDQIYAEGELVTRSGLWLALKSTAATPGSDPTCWKLICKQGR